MEGRCWGGEKKGILGGVSGGAQGHWEERWRMLGGALGVPRRVLLGCAGGCSEGCFESAQGCSRVLRECVGALWRVLQGCSWVCSWVCSKDAQGVLRALGPSRGCPGAASALDHSGQECFQSTPGSGMEALSVAGQLGEGRKAPSPGGTLRDHRVRAGKGPQSLGIAVEVPRVVFSLKAEP